MHLSYVTRFILVALLVGGLTACSGSQSPTDGGTRIAVADHAPAFSAPDQTGKLRSLDEFRDKYVVLYFYPKDATPGCTKEACAFRDRWTELESAGAQVLGVSMDSVESHAKFAKEENLPFPLLADPNGHVTSAYNVPTSLGFARRMTYIIDKHGIVRRIFPDVDPAVHADEVIATIRELERITAASK